jgi:nucleotidyltransferase/DNA polymerase involved in DNA repair
MKLKSSFLNTVAQVLKLIGQLQKQCSKLEGQQFITGHFERHRQVSNHIREIEQRLEKILKLYSEE